jgi:hypothetical protein
MRGRKRLSHVEIQQLLRAADPGAGDSLTPGERRRIEEVGRTGGRECGEEHTKRQIVLRLAAAAGAIVALTAGVWVLSRWSADHGPASQVVVGPVASDQRAQQIQMVMPGGTRLIWVLQLGNDAFQN